MNEIKRDLSRLCQAAGVAGMPEITEVAKELLSPLVDTIEVDAMGSVLGVRKAANPDAPTIMLEAHLDEIGFLVTYFDSAGFMYVAPAGGIDGRVLTAQEVLVHAPGGPLRGVFCSTPPHIAGKDGELPELSKRGIDLGLTAEEAKAQIPLGTRVTFAPSFCELNENAVTAKALDDRAGMAAILHCLRTLGEPVDVNVAVAFCVQEELGCRGAAPAVRRLQPDEAIVTDVSFALTPDADPHSCGELGKGVMIGISPILSGRMSDRLLSLADECSIPYQTEVMGGRTGTDADHITNALLGVPSALLSIPQRYMHTPIEVVDVRDVAAVGDLMAAYIKKGGACV
ncbi:MAG: M20/M25/M40 family metallo-hydrolase [Clostridia bacterium]|nr:M20/M25/M40 family metallo-hydrolase [Clostridia bacterium]